MIWLLLSHTSVWVSMLFSTSVIIRMMAQTLSYRTLPNWLVVSAELANNLWNELKYVYLAVEIFGPFIHNAAYHEKASAWDYLATAFGVAYWWYFRRYFDDDDRWTKRKKKLVEKVSQVGGRLVVVPAR